jgi:hypothetical protein
MLLVWAAGCADSEGNSDGGGVTGTTGTTGEEVSQSTGGEDVQEEEDNGPSDPDTGKSEPDVKEPPVDPLAFETLLEHWFDDYNKGTDQSYLTAAYETLPDGHSDHPLAVAHEVYSDVAYGPFNRNRLDFYRVKNATKATPVAVFIHGGGFKGGDKSQVNKPPTDIDRLLKEGISVAGIIYRWAYKDSELAKLQTNPQGTGDVHNVNGARLDTIFRDCARAIQFLRFKAEEWNIDKSAIGAWGGSAGAGCAMWIGTTPDLANPNAGDPVLRESSRLTVVGHNNGQVTYNWPRWPELLNMDKDFVYGHIRYDAERLAQLSLEDQSDTQLGKELSSILDYYEHLGPDGPAIYTVNAKQDSDESTIEKSGDVIHHPRGHVAIYDRCVEMGLTCEIKTKLKNSNYKGSLIDFFIEQLIK